jgi:hypothetical protein
MTRFPVSTAEDIEIFELIKDDRKTSNSRIVGKEMKL